MVETWSLVFVMCLPTQTNMCPAALERGYSTKQECVMSANAKIPQPQWWMCSSTVSGEQIHKGDAGAR